MAAEWDREWMGRKYRCEVKNELKVEEEEKKRWKVWARRVLIPPRSLSVVRSHELRPNARLLSETFFFCARCFSLAMMLSFYNYVKCSVLIGYTVLQGGKCELFIVYILSGCDSSESWKCIDETDFLRTHFCVFLPGAVQFKPIFSKILPIFRIFLQGLLFPDPFPVDFSLFQPVLFSFGTFEAVLVYFGLS